MDYRRGINLDLPGNSRRSISAAWRAFRHRQRLARHGQRSAFAAVPGSALLHKLFTSSTSIFIPQSVPAHEIFRLSIFVLLVTGVVGLTVGSLLLYVIIRYRQRPGDEEREPPQIYGSNQIELAWTVIPILIVVVLFLSTVRLIFTIQHARIPPQGVTAQVIGHQFWWEFRYPQYNVVTANELHLPVSSKDAPRPAFMKLTSADVMHSFWVPQLDGKTDVLPNRVNEMWIDPHETGLYVGQCAQFCGAEHAKMLLRVYVDTPEQFKAWIASQQRTQAELTAVPGGPQGSANETAPNVGNEGGVVRAAATKAPPNSPTSHGNVTPDMGEQQISAQMGQYVFEHEACISCHTVAGTVATGRYGPDLTHLMSRDTIASGAFPNTKQNLLAWINDPNQLKPGSLMPAMHLSDTQNEQITAYLMTLK